MSDGKLSKQEYDYVKRVSSINSNGIPSQHRAKMSELSKKDPKGVSDAARSGIKELGGRYSGIKD